MGSGAFYYFIECYGCHFHPFRCFFFCFMEIWRIINFGWWQPTILNLTTHFGVNFRKFRITKWQTQKLCVVTYSMNMKNSTEAQLKINFLSPPLFFCALAILYSWSINWQFRDVESSGKTILLLYFYVALCYHTCF